MREDSQQCICWLSNSDKINRGNVELLTGIAVQEDLFLHTYIKDELAFDILRAHFEFILELIDHA
jgi:hypothetical protein